MSKLFIISTPIGNLNDVTKNTINSLAETNVLFCEDTRNTKKLLSLLDIDFSNKEFISINSYNESEKIDNIKFLENTTYCIVSDAGYPLISDPGYLILKKAITQNINIEVINGPSALMHALMVCGYPINNFYFNGFLSKNKKEAQEKLKDLFNIKSILILYESVHNIINTLKLIKTIFGKEKEIFVCKELTKINETHYRGNADYLIENIDLRGEFVIVINNIELKKEENENYSLYNDEVQFWVKQGQKLKDACKIVAYKYNISSNKLFNSLHSNKNLV